MNVFPTSRAFDLPVLPEQQRWLIEDLWADQAVGVIGGEPKSNKSVLALDMSVAVASGTPCLGCFETMQKGRVLIFAAEDAQHVVRSRLDGLARARGLDLEGLDVHVITAPSLRLDLENDRQLLVATVESLSPRLLVLDPFVRLHRRERLGRGGADVGPPARAATTLLVGCRVGTPRQEGGEPHAWRPGVTRLE